MKITFLGGGNMATALIGGLLERGFAATGLQVIDLGAEARARLAARFGVRAVEVADDEALACEVLVLAVKPQQMRAALAPLAGRLGGQLVISIAAGLRLAAIGRWLGEPDAPYRRLVRCMPNTPALVGAGITGLFAAPEVTPAERGAAESILRAVGEVVWVAEERLLDPVTAVSGSGPAYVFWFIEQLAASGEKLGLAPEVALKLALHTVLGSAKLAAASAQAPGELRRQVTSKGGTTEAALRVFDDERMAERFTRALEAASRRGAALGDELGKD